MKGMFYEVTFNFGGSRSGTVFQRSPGERRGPPLAVIRPPMTDEVSQCPVDQDLLVERSGMSGLWTFSNLSW